MFAHRSLRGIGIPAFILAAVPILLLVTGADARPLRGLPLPSTGMETIRGGVQGAVKASGDTILLMGPQGSGALHIGSFETGSGQPAWNGWTSRDDSELDINPWHADTYHAVSGLYSAWCGEARFAACEPGDEAGGYGNDYKADLVWRGTVADPLQPCTVTIAAVVNLDIEVVYDWFQLQVETAGGIYTLWSRDGQAAGIALDGAHTYQPGDYLGAGGDEVVVRFRVLTDVVWSDEDCLAPSSGAVQLDDVVITMSNGAGAAHDFEDGTLGPFTTPLPVKVGDFAQLWTGLEDYDPCQTNYSTQVAFIDDGLVVPGTGGAPCINWCYGPNGWIVNTTGGLAGPESHLHNAVLSPVMAWPDGGADGGLLSFDVYEHEDLSNDAPGIFWTWSVRSAAGADPAELEAAPWRSDNLVQYGRPAYERWNVDVSALLEPGCGQVQVRLAAKEWGYNWNWDGDDGYPAPYFDNVRFAAFALGGPAMSAEERHLAQDAFPTAGSFDPAAPGLSSVRFDMARNVAPRGAPIAAGDSLVFDAKVVRNGAVLAGAPRLHYRLKRNAHFDPWRSSGLPDLGSVACDSARALGGNVIVDRWAADLPDEGFLFPGDVLHYYFSATDNLAGDLRTATLPADTAGFSDFGDHGRWSEFDHRFVVRALPTITWPGSNISYWSQPDYLLWFDGDEGAAWDRWQLILNQLCLWPGVYADIYTSRAAAAMAGNGLGAAATPAQIAAYEGIVYTSGSLSGEVLGDGDDVNEASPDLQLLAAWLDQGYKGLVLGGDNLAGGLMQAVGGQAFLNGRLGAIHQSSDLRPLINSQHSPGVLVMAGDPAFTWISSWRLDGGCPSIATFDAIVNTGTGQRAAQFANASGSAGGYPYAAAVRNSVLHNGSRSVLLPYGQSRVVADPLVAPVPGGRLAASVVVHDALAWAIDDYWLHIECWSGVEDEVPAARFTASAYPNPFNPRVRIDYTVARAGRLTVKIFDLRGRLVRVLLDEQVTGGGRIDWDGTDGSGAASASGVYFYEARMDNEVEVGKLALIR